MEVSDQKFAPPPVALRRPACFHAESNARTGVSLLFVLICLAIAFDSAAPRMGSALATAPARHPHDLRVPIPVQTRLVVNNRYPGNQAPGPLVLGVPGYPGTRVPGATITRCASVGGPSGISGVTFPSLQTRAGPRLYHAPAGPGPPCPTWGPRTLFDNSFHLIFNFQLNRGCHVALRPGPSAIQKNSLES
eukprot:475824-Rhodomonas_salina.2